MKSTQIGELHLYSGEKKPGKFLNKPPFFLEFCIGRNNDLKAIHEMLFTGEHLLLLVNGVGGIGKTTLAAEYVKTYQDSYEHLAWIYAGKSMLEALLTLSIPLGCDNFPENMPNRERLNVLLTEMSNLEKPCLLVIDNANKLSDLEKYYSSLRSCPNFHLLLTTRITSFENATVYPVGYLGANEAFNLFKFHYPAHREEDDEFLKNIFELIDFNTLLIELLAKNLNILNRHRNRYYLKDVLNDLKNKSLLSLSQSSSIRTPYNNEGEFTSRRLEDIILAMYDLSNLSKTENRILAMFSVLPAENIEFYLIEKKLIDKDELYDYTVPSDQSEFSKTYLDENPIEVIIEETLLNLTEKGWLNYNKNDESFKISPVIQNIVRKKKKSELLKHCNFLINEIIENLLINEDNSDFVFISFKEAVILSRYALSVLDNITEINPLLVNLWEKVSKAFEILGNMEEASEYLEEYYDLVRQLHEKEPDNELARNELVNSYFRRGEQASLVGNWEYALNIYSKGIHYVENLLVQNLKKKLFNFELAMMYKNKGEIEINLSFLEDALESFSRVSFKLCQRLS